MTTGKPIDARKSAVLKAVIQQHIQTGEPVGSRKVSQEAKLRLSPASIRSIMAELEDCGLLSRPHSSAGRLPTDRGYRMYVDNMISRPKMAASHALAIDEALTRNRGEMAEMMSEASRQLSQLSNQVGIVLAPDLRRMVIEHVEFIRLDHDRVIAILVGKSGIVHNRILQVEKLPSQRQLDAIGRYLSEEYSGFTLPQMRESLRARRTEEKAAYDLLVAAVRAEGGENDIFVGGFSNLLGLHGFTDLDAIRALVRTLEEKDRLIDLLDRVLEGKGVQVLIGEENPLSDLSHCSLVASRYGSGRDVAGMVGIVGPRRMPYAKGIALVDYLAKVLTKILSNEAN
jgi:heat-inducible transcriptional repressor